MSRPKKIHKPISAPFDQILAAVAMGKGKGKTAVEKLARKKRSKKAAQKKKPDLVAP